MLPLAALTRSRADKRRCHSPNFRYGSVLLGRGRPPFEALYQLTLTLSDEPITKKASGIFQFSSATLSIWARHPWRYLREVGPINGDVAVTSFILSTSGWVDGDLPLIRLQVDVDVVGRTVDEDCIEHISVKFRPIRPRTRCIPWMPKYAGMSRAASD